MAGTLAYLDEPDVFDAGPANNRPEPGTRIGSAPIVSGAATPTGRHRTTLYTRPSPCATPRPRLRHVDPDESTTRRAPRTRSSEPNSTVGPW